MTRKKKLSSRTTNAIEWEQKKALTRIEKVEAPKVYHNKNGNLQTVNICTTK